MQEQQEQPLVSVVMATYNGERFLDEQLLSIRNQTYTNLEIIVVDDASTDGTVDILRRHAEQDDRIRVHINASNQGTTTTFETGFALAQGEFIAISDQDDVWLPEKIETLLRHIGNCAGIYTDSVLIDEQGCETGQTLFQRLGVSRPVTGTDFFALLNRNCVSGHALVLRKRIVDLVMPFDRAQHFFYDQQLAIFTMMAGGLVCHDRALTLHRMHDCNQVNRLFRAGARKNRTPLERRERHGRARYQMEHNIGFVLCRLDGAASGVVSLPGMHRSIDALKRIHRRLLGRRRFDPLLFYYLFSERHRMFPFSRRPLSACRRLCRYRLEEQRV